MNTLKQKRNEHIRARFRELREDGKDFFTAIDTIHSSPENNLWCLTFDSIRTIATQKTPHKRAKKV